MNREQRIWEAVYAAEWLRLTSTFGDAFEHAVANACMRADLAVSEWRNDKPESYTAKLKAAAKRKGVSK